MRRFAVLILIAVLLGSGCRKEKLPPDASATSATTASTIAASQPVTTTATIDVSAPTRADQLRDPSYWNAILATLNHKAGDAYRSAVMAGAAEPPAVEALRQIYGPTTFQDEHDLLIRVAAGERNGLLVPPGDAVASVTRILKADASCVVLEATIDYSKVNPTVPTALNVLELLPRQKNAPTDINPTPWIVDEFFIRADPNDGDRLCVG